MATRLKAIPPTTAEANEPIRYECENCGESGFTDPEAHALKLDHDRYLMIDMNLPNWYKE